MPKLTKILTGRLAIALCLNLMVGTAALSQNLQEENKASKTSIPETGDASINAARKTFIAFRQAEEEKNWEKIAGLLDPECTIVLLQEGGKKEMSREEWKGWVKAAPDPNQGPIYYEHITFERSGDENTEGTASLVEVRGVRRNQAFGQDGQFYMRMKPKGQAGEMTIDHHAWEPSEIKSDTGGSMTPQEDSEEENLPPVIAPGRQMPTSEKKPEAKTEALTIRGQKSQDLEAVSSYLWGQLSKEESPNKIDVIKTPSSGAEPGRERIEHGILIENIAGLQIPKLTLISARLIPIPELASCKILVTRRNLPVTPEGTVPGQVMAEAQGKSAELLNLLPID